MHIAQNYYTHTDYPIYVARAGRKQNVHSNTYACSQRVERDQEWRTRAYTHVQKRGMIFYREGKPWSGGASVWYHRPQIQLCPLPSILNLERIANLAGELPWDTQQSSSRGKRKDAFLLRGVRTSRLADSVFNPSRSL